MQLQVSNVHGEVSLADLLEDQEIARKLELGK